MAKKKAAALVPVEEQKKVPAAMPGPDPFAAPEGADLSYMPEALRLLAVRADSLLMDPLNVKDHGDIDLPAHQASLKKFGIRRAVVVRRENRQIEAGNGTVLAALRNNWEYVPVLFVDDDHSLARAFSLADNAVSTLAVWNEVNLQKIADDAPALFDEPDLAGLAEQLLEDLARVVGEEEDAEPEEDPASAEDLTKDVTLSRRVIAICEDEDKQIALLKELSERGFECRLSTVRIH
ncbi:hypothetical protein [Schlesneria sp.]|uniref:hypothetical protein n=1 Tax=Schlesneria sp. TaxID=2762018 RepID=UPI002EE2D9E6